MDKEDIFDNIENYDASQLAAFINRGLFTFDELIEGTEGYLSALVKRELKQILAGSEEDDWKKAKAADTIEEYDKYLRTYPEGNYRSDAREAKERILESGMNDIWNAVDKSDTNALQEFIDKYPDSQYVARAREIINSNRPSSRERYRTSNIERLVQEVKDELIASRKLEIIIDYVSTNRVTTDEVYEEIAKNHNLFPAYIVDELEKKGIIQFSDLEEKSNIDRRFLEFIINNSIVSPEITSSSFPIEEVGKPTTEIYFWGIPASGKTCALGAILTELQHGGYVEFAEPVTTCQGYDYMTNLSNIFDKEKDVALLPPGTGTDEIFEMRYILHRNKRIYPVTFIDLAGEVIEAMYLKNGNKDLSPRQQGALDLATKLITGNHKENRKVHFFVLEYNGHEKKYKGHTQYDLLVGAMQYIKTQGVFKNATDAIYLLITKSDLTGATSNDERKQILTEYIKDHYMTFYKGLEILCKQCEITEGKVDVVPFSIGNVCFQNLCLYNNSSATVVIKNILERVKGLKTSKLFKIFGK